VTTYQQGVTYYTFDANTYEYVEASISNQADITNSAVTVYKFVPYTSSQTKPNPYVLSDWLQEATIKVTALDGSTASGAAVLNADHFTYDHINDTTAASVAYKIINDAGYELPSTGGPGTALFKIFGAMLAVFATAGLVWIRRKAM
jgi:LPXTG-motif cell wall-anchored protein